MKLFVSFVVKNALNAMFGPNKQIFSVKSIIFIKKYKKSDCSFMKTYLRNSQIFELLCENFPKLAKILRLSSKFWRITLKKCKNVTKKLIFTKLFASFVVQNALNAIFGPNEQIFSPKSIMFIKKNKKPCSFLKMYWRNPQIFLVFT